MPRPPDTPGKPRKNLVTTRLTDEGLAALDRQRGSQTRAEYVRALIKADIARRKK